MTKQYMHFFEIRQTVSVTDQGSVVLFSHLYTFASVERLEPVSMSSAAFPPLPREAVTGRWRALRCLHTAATTLTGYL